MTKKPSTINEKELPRWLVRRWRLLQGVVRNPDFVKALPHLSEEYRANANLPAENCFKAIRDFKIPGDCVSALWKLLEHPEYLKDPQKLIEYIKPPIQYVSYKQKQRGLADNPSKAFRYWEQKRQELNAKGMDFVDEFDGVFLEIASYTTKQELISFIDENFEVHLKPLLQGGEGYFTPAALRSGRVRVPSELRERILALHRRGKTPIEIEKALGYEHWASNISKVISEAEKSSKQG